jgi:hypothetical protein
MHLTRGRRFHGPPHVKAGGFMLTRIRRSLPIFAISALILACDDGGPDPDRYEATLTGSGEVPANASQATGTAVLTDRGGSFDYRIDVQNIDFATAAHIHAGAEGVNGGIIVPLFNTGNPVASFSGRLVTDSFTQADIVALPGATGPISMDSLRVLMRTGGAYINVHTTGIPAGEIRGQVVRR